MARRVLERIYPSATLSQLKRKVDEMIESVQIDNTLGQASLKQKLNKLLYIGSNRRALGQSLSLSSIGADGQWSERVYKELNNFLGSTRSCITLLPSLQR
jgi:hypothetical protein